MPWNRITSKVDKVFKQGRKSCGIQGGLNELRFCAMAASLLTNEEWRTTT